MNTKTYTVCYAVAEVYIQVEANSPEEAEELAEEQLAELDTALCFQCSNRIETCDPYHVNTELTDD
jgi:hypothetical protein